MNNQTTKKPIRKTYDQQGKDTYNLIENISKSIPEFIENKVINPYFRHQNSKPVKRNPYPQNQPSQTSTIQSNGNYAFIDAQNLHQSSKHWGWKLDYEKLRNFLRDEYNVKVAYLFMGFIADNQEIYNNLQKKGYILVFKETSENMDIVKGNCDVELVLQAMIDFNNFDQAVIVSGDGDFSAMIRHFYQQNKLAQLLVPNKSAYSKFLQKTAKEKIGYLNLLKSKLADKSFEDAQGKNKKVIGMDSAVAPVDSVQDKPANSSRPKSRQPRVTKKPVTTVNIHLD